MGLFFLTISLVCLILFFVFASQMQYRRLGLFLADAAHSTLLVVSLIAMAVGAYRYTDIVFTLLVNLSVQILIRKNHLVLSYQTIQAR